MVYHATVAAVRSSLQFQRAVFRGWRTLWREGRASGSILLIACLLTLVSLLLAILLAVQVGGEQLRRQAQVRLDVVRTATNDEVQQLAIALRGLPGISRVTLITKEETLAIEKARDPQVVEFIDKFHLENPFPDSLAITLGTVESYRELDRLVRDPRWQTVVDPTFLSQATAQEAQVLELLGATQGLMQAVVTLLVLAGVALIVGVSSLLHQRVLQRRADLHLQRLLGARPAELFLPLWTEGTLLLWCGTLLAAAAIAGGTVSLLWLGPTSPSAFVQGLVVQLEPLFLSAGLTSLLACLACAPVVSAFTAGLGLLGDRPLAFLRRTHA
jgi:cell division protein FtsX